MFDGSVRDVHARPSGDVSTVNGPPTATNWWPSHATSSMFAMATRSVQINRSVELRMSLPALTYLPAPYANAPVGAPMRLVVHAMPGVVASAITVNDAEEVFEPPDVTTWIVPLVAPAGTVTSIAIVVAASTMAVTPLKRTVLPAAPATKPRPSMRTCCPGAPAEGVKLMISGGELPPVVGAGAAESPP